MNIPNYGLLDPVPSDPAGYMTKDGTWSAVPFGDKFVILYNGQQVHVANNYSTAKSYIKKNLKQTKNITSTLETFL